MKDLIVGDVAPPSPDFRVPGQEWLNAQNLAGQRVTGYRHGSAIPSTILPDPRLAFPGTPVMTRPGGVRGLPRTIGGPDQPLFPPEKAGQPVSSRFQKEQSVARTATERAQITQRQRGEVALQRFNERMRQAKDAASKAQAEADYKADLASKEPLFTLPEESPKASQFQKGQSLVGDVLERGKINQRQRGAVRVGQPLEQVPAPSKPKVYEKPAQRQGPPAPIGAPSPENVAAMGQLRTLMAEGKTLKQALKEVGKKIEKDLGMFQ